MSLQNKVAIVTGANSVIGTAIALKLTEEGAQVVIVGRTEVKLKNTSEICEAHGLKPLTIIADVTVDDDLKEIIAKTISLFGKFDILVNSAGSYGNDSILNKSYMSHFDKVLLANFRSAVYLTHLAAEHLSATKGNIVNIGSVSAYKIFLDKSSAYPTSKAGLIHFTKCVAQDFAAKGVRVNIICPGPVIANISTERYSEKQDTENMLNQLKNRMSLNRLSEAEEIADFVAYISSDKGRSFTGSSIVIDNGMLVGTYFKPSKY